MNAAQKFAAVMREARAGIAAAIRSGDFETARTRLDEVLSATKGRADYGFSRRDFILARLNLRAKPNYAAWIVAG